MFNPKIVMEVVDSLIKITMALGVYAPGFEPGCNCESEQFNEDEYGRLTCQECGHPSEG